MWLRILTFVLAIQHSLTASFVVPDVDWNADAKATLQNVLHQKENNNRAKNVVMFLGDGMGLSTITAARTYKGQQAGNPGEETVLNFEKLPYVGLAKTYNVDFQVPDSAGTGTAYLCGVKANYGTLGVTHHVKRGDCEAQQRSENQVDSILRWSFENGKAVGIVTTARITHASPAASYARAAERYWESDGNLDSKYNGTCPDIAQQLIENHGYIQVIMGGGRRSFWPKEERDPEYPDKNGTRVDSQNLFEAWKEKRQLEGVSYAAFTDKEGFDNVDPATTDYVLGLFEYSHMQYEVDRRKQNPPTEPSLVEMTEMAISILKRHDKGFFLFVEGGKIDLAHHDTLAKKALEEVIVFDNAIAKGLSMVNQDETLLIVTADHSHTFTQGGYPARGQSILGFVGADSEKIEKTLDDNPTLILSYANGPVSGRENLTGVDTEDDEFLIPALVPMKYETHSAEDVAVYAQGPHAHLIRGSTEQNYIAHVMGYASCVGDHIPKGDHCSPSTAATMTSFGFRVMLVFLYLIHFCN